MRITSVTTTLSAEDILHDLKTLVEPQVPELTFHEVVLQENFLEITGTFRKFIGIPFLARVRILSVLNNVLTLRMERVKVLKIGIPQFALNLASKTLAKKAEEMGLTYADKALSVNIDSVLQKSPHVHLVVDNLAMMDGVLTLAIKGIEADVAALQAEANKDKEAEEEAKRQAEEARLKEFNRKLGLIPHTADSYSDFRKKLLKKIPAGRKNLGEYAFLLPDLYVLAYRLMKDKRVAKRDKVVLGVTFGYPLLPFDLLPDKMPILGKVDDLALIFFGANHMLTKIPVPILVKHWQGELKTLKLLRDNLGTLVGFTPAKTLDQVYGMVDGSLEKKKPSYLPDEEYLLPDEVKPLDLDPIFQPVLQAKPEEPVKLGKNIPEENQKK